MGEVYSQKRKRMLKIADHCKQRLYDSAEREQSFPKRKLIASIWRMDIKYYFGGECSQGYRQPHSPFYSLIIYVYKARLISAANI